MSEAAFLAAIRAEPADDAARLVYADWLHENGEDARAELIRVQIELARPRPPQPATMTYSLVSSEEHVQQVLTFKATTERRRVLEIRERELLATACIPLPSGWAVGVGLGLTVRAPRGDLFLRRGLGERAVSSGAVWVADGDVVLATQPVERVRLTSWPAFDHKPEGLVLSADRTSRCFPFRQINEYTPPQPVDVRITLLRLRFGSNITFELP